jgi:hypothetical protein
MYSTRRYCTRYGSMGRRRMDYSISLVLPDHYGFMAMPAAGRGMQVRCANGIITGEAYRYRLDVQRHFRTRKTGLTVFLHCHSRRRMYEGSISPFGHFLYLPGVERYVSSGSSPCLAAAVCLYR